MRGPGPDTSFAAFERRLGPLLDELFLTMLRENRDRIKAEVDAESALKMRKMFRSALALGSDQGLADVSFADIARGAGVTERELGKFFADKDELRSYVLRYWAAFVARTVLVEAEGEATARDQLAAAVRTQLYLEEAMREWFFYSYMEARYLGREERHQAMANEKLTETMFVDILKRGQEQGEFWLRDLDLTAAVLKAMIQDWYLKHWKFRKLATSVEEYAEFVIGFMMDAIGEE